MVNKKNILWFIHPLKTGGTSIHSFFNNESMSNNDFYWKSHDRYSENVMIDLKSKYEKVITFTNLRCPVAHTRSIYIWSRNLAKRKIERIEKFGLNSNKKNLGRFSDSLYMSFSEWIRHEKGIENFFTEWFSLKGKKSFEEVKLEMDSYDYILDTHHLKSGVNSLISDIGESIVFSKHYGNNFSSYFDIKKEDVEYIKRKRILDYELIERFNIFKSY
jgi:hypothetical protein